MERFGDGFDACFTIHGHIESRLDICLIVSRGQRRVCWTGLTSKDGIAMVEPILTLFSLDNYVILLRMLRYF